jgi:hypothetical protein
VTEHGSIAVTLPADVQQIDQTGLVWSILDEADEPDRVRPGAPIVAGDPVEPFLARVTWSMARTAGRSSTSTSFARAPSG